MFHRATDASKVALAGLVGHRWPPTATRDGCSTCSGAPTHLATLGVHGGAAAEYRGCLADALTAPLPDPSADLRTCGPSADVRTPAPGPHVRIRADEVRGVVRLVGRLDQLVAAHPAPRGHVGPGRRVGASSRDQRPRRQVADGRASRITGSGQRSPRASTSTTSAPSSRLALGAHRSGRSPSCARHGRPPRRAARAQNAGRRPLVRGLARRPPPPTAASTRTLPWVSTPIAASTWLGSQRARPCTPTRTPPRSPRRSSSSTSASPSTKRHENVTTCGSRSTGSPTTSSSGTRGRRRPDLVHELARARRSLGAVRGRLQPRLGRGEHQRAPPAPRRSGRLGLAHRARAAPPGPLRHDEHADAGRPAPRRGRRPTSTSSGRRGTASRPSAACASTTSGTPAARQAARAAADRLPGADLAVRALQARRPPCRAPRARPPTRRQSTRPTVDRDLDQQRGDVGAAAAARPGRSTAECSTAQATVRITAPPARIPDAARPPARQRDRTARQEADLGRRVPRAPPRSPRGRRRAGAGPGGPRRGAGAGRPSRRPARPGGRPGRPGRRGAAAPSSRTRARPGPAGPGGVDTPVDVSLTSDATHPRFWGCHTVG